MLAGGVAGGVADPGWRAPGGRRWTALRRAVDAADVPIDLASLVAQTGAGGSATITAPVVLRSDRASAALPFDHETTMTDRPVTEEEANAF